MTASAVAPSATVPTANQFVPPLLEYCHTPCVPALVVFPTIATPAMLEPVSTSANWPVNIVLIDWPDGLAVSSTIDASVPLPKVGASFAAVTVSVRESSNAE